VGGRPNGRAASPAAHPDSTKAADTIIVLACDRVEGSDPIVVAASYRPLI